MQIPFLDKNQAVAPFLIQTNQVFLVQENTSLFTIDLTMYFTYTRSSYDDLETIHRLITEIPPIPFEFIFNEDQLQQNRSAMVRLMNSDCWTLLGTHEEVSPGGYYEFIVTLLIYPHPCRQYLAHIHHNQRLPSFVLGSYNSTTNATNYPCILYDLETSFDPNAMTPLQDFLTRRPDGIRPL